MNYVMLYSLSHLFILNLLFTVQYLQYLQVDCIVADHKKIINIMVCPHCPCQMPLSSCW